MQERSCNRRVLVFQWQLACCDENIFRQTSLKVVDLPLIAPLAAQQMREMMEV